MRGRQPLFGTRAAHWGEVWTPGANWATVLEVSKDITLNGRAVPKGKYSVWMVLREAGDWTTVLEPKWHLYHMEPPDSNATQVRITTPVSLAPFVDVLTWSMPELTVSGGTLAMQWGTTRLAFAMIRVGPDIFTPGLYDKDGSIYEVLRPDMMFTFRSVAGQPVTFSVRSFDDSLEATGTKKP